MYRYVVFVVLFQWFQKVHVTKKFHGRSPVFQNLTKQQYYSAWMTKICLELLLHCKYLNHTACHSWRVWLRWAFFQIAKHSSETSCGKDFNTHDNNALYWWDLEILWIAKCMLVQWMNVYAWHLSCLFCVRCCSCVVFWIILFHCIFIIHLLSKLYFCVI